MTLHVVAALAIAGLLFGTLSQVLIYVLRGRLRRLGAGVWKLARRVEDLDVRGELNGLVRRVAELEHRAGVAPKPVHIDMRGTKPVVDAEFEDDPPLVRAPRLGDPVEVDAGVDGATFEGEVSLVDHTRKLASVTSKAGEVRNFPWGSLRFVA